MIRHTRYITTVMLSSLLLNACSSSKKTAGNANDLPHLFLENVVADGSDADWKDASLQYNKHTKVVYAISNDKEAIHVLLRFAGQSEQMKVLRGGLEVWLDTKGGKKKNISVKYPMRNTGEALQGGMRPPQQDGQRPDMNEMRERMLLQKNTIELAGFKTELNGIFQVNQTIGVKAALKYDRNELIYELTIPLTAIDEQLNNESTLALGVSVKGVEMPSRSGGMGGRGGGGMPPGGGGMGGRGGGGGMGPRGGGQGAGSGQAEDMSQETSFWQKFSLAGK